jgi:PAS domain S-box-containing protein
MEGFDQSVAGERAARLPQIRSAILENAAAGQPLGELSSMLADLVGLAEPGTQVSIHRLDTRSGRLTRIGASRLPDFFNAAMDVVEVAASAAPLARAAHTGRRVIVDDLQAQAAGDQTGALYERAGLRASVADPILAADGRVLGTFTIYRGGPAGSRSWDSDTNRFAFHVATLVMQRDQLQSDLRACEVRQNAILSAIPDLVVVFDSHRRYQQVYTNTPEMLVQPIAKLIGRTVHEVIPPSTADLLDQAIRDTLEKESPQSLEYCITAPAGVRWLSATVVPFTWRDERCVLWVARDITSRKLAQRELRRAERQLAAVQRIGQVGSWEWDVVSNQVWWSDELYRIVGVDPQTFHPTIASSLELVVPADRPLVTNFMEVSIWHDDSFAMVIRIQAGGGAVRFLSVEGSVERDSSGRPLRVVGTSRDETERLASLGTLAAGIAHEISNPMTAAWIAAETAKSVKHKEGSEQIVDESLDAIGDAVRRCRVIIDNVLRFARQESSQKVAHDINDIVQRAVETTRHYAHYHGSVISVNPGHGLSQAIVNAAEIEQVLVNLIRNAVQAGRGTRISVRTEERNGAVHVQVSDDGRGIPDENLEHIFDPFFTGSDSGEGTGLGLSISHGIIEDHGGTIGVESRMGQGSTFTVSLPLAGGS